MGRGEGGVAAQIDFDRRRQPSKLISIPIRMQESRFGKVHLAGNIVHPFVVTRNWKNTDSCRISGERNCGEGIHLDDRNAHDSIMGQWFVERGVLPPSAREEVL
jgi:hypothetical protein